MFLLSLLMSFGMVGMMAPKASSSRAAKSQAAAAKAKAKAKAKALASDTVEKKGNNQIWWANSRMPASSCRKSNKERPKSLKQRWKSLRQSKSFGPNIVGFPILMTKRVRCLKPSPLTRPAPSGLPGPKRSARRLTKTLLAQMAISPVHWPAFIFLKFFFPHRSWCNLKQINSY